MVTDYLGRDTEPRPRQRTSDDEILDIVNRDAARRMSHYSARHRRSEITPKARRPADSSEPPIPPTRAHDFDEEPEPDERSVAFWDGVGIEPVEIDLPGGVGYTLRQVPDGDSPTRPLFLGSEGRTRLFRSRHGLAEYIRGTVPHDLTCTKYWWAVTDAVDLDLTPQRLNRYELDLIVDIVRAGHIAWSRSEVETILLAGELGRDIAGYTQDADLLDIFATGTSLDRLDDDLRTADRSAVRRLRRNNYYQLALSWRRAIGIIAHSMDWND